MNYEENDPDTLQLRDELDPEWVNLWHKSANKKNKTKEHVTFDVISTKKIVLQKFHRHSKKTP